MCQFYFIKTLIQNLRGKVTNEKWSEMRIGDSVKGYSEEITRVPQGWWITDKFGSTFIHDVKKITGD